MKAIFVVPFKAGLGPDLTMEQLGAVEGARVADGTGWSVVGHVPFAKTCLVRIVASKAVIAALSEEPDYAFVEEVVEASDAAS